jgi:hypothetical protein
MARLQRAECNNSALNQERHRRSISIAPGWSVATTGGSKHSPLLFPIFCQPIGLAKNWEKVKRKLHYPPALPGAIDMQALTGLCTAEQLPKFYLFPNDIVPKASTM